MERPGLPVDPHQEAREFCAVLGRFLSLISAALFIFACSVAAILWLTAVHDNMLLSAVEMDHWNNTQGPWHYFDSGVSMLEALVVTLFSGAVIALLSLFVNPRMRTGALLMLQIFGCLGALYFLLLLG